jgi:hypothetical protein
LFARQKKAVSHFWQMNKAALITVGKKFHEDSMFLLSVFDLEPSGVIIHAYNQADSKEYSLPVTEMEVGLLGSMFICNLISLFVAGRVRIFTQSSKFGGDA